MTALRRMRRLTAFRLLRAGVPKSELDAMTTHDVEELAEAEAEARLEDADLLALAIARGIHGGG